MDGYVTIGTELDTKNFDKKLNDLKKKYENEQINLEIKTTELEKEQKEVADLENQLENIRKKQSQINSAIEERQKIYDNITEKIKKGEAISTGEYLRYDRIGSELLDLKEKSAQLNKEQDKYNRKWEKTNDNLTKVEKKYEIQKNKVEQARTAYEQYNEEIKKTNMEQIKESISSIGKGIEKTTKKVKRWALAIFGIRSAYMMIRQSMSTISENDEQLKADIDYIKNAIAYTLEPIVRGIVNLVKQLMEYIGYIIYEWTGYNIFENANKSLQKTNKQANELKKTLSSFDEMNILGDNSSNDSGTGAPSFDLTDIENIEPPGWVKFIANNKDAILALLSGVVGYLASIKLGIKGIKALGIGIAITGIIYAIEKILDFMEDPTFENFIGILEGIAVAVIGIGIAFGNLPLAIAGAIALIIIELVKNFDKIEKMFNDLTKWFDTEFLGALRRLFGPIGDLIYLPFKAAIELVHGLFSGLTEGVSKVIDGIILMFDGDFIGGISEIFSGLFEILIAPFNATYTAVKETFELLVNFIIDIVNGMIDAINILPFVDIPKIPRIGQTQKEKKGGGGFRAKGGIYYPSKFPKLAVGGIINNPGPGVMYNGAYIGERGAEAVVPLTDSQQMELLGSTIGRYITVEITNVTQLDGRQIARKVDKIQQNNNFVLNR